ncbi:fimbrial protein [Buttiauxella selenatireducens]|uniref:Fimbrial protein n=1 Tax=Buttiauxella selenatireducens TaxID=3073902 RepID=A0ABY9SD98_9ENTR|nr:fimbrial protein [Buttiauxella sp. R73]WMY75328.1 fimbrial protein [Buttiauxella sp. R73]
MKKNLIVVAFAAVTALSASNAMASAGTVNFTGQILDAACNVDVASQNQTVALGSYYKTEFVNTGDVTAAKKFTIVLKDCPSTVTAAHVMFDGTPETTDATLLAIDSTVPGAATNVAINLKTADMADLALHGDNGYRYLLSSTQDNNLDFYAQYKSTAMPVTQGPANSVASFSVVYN